MARAVHPWGVEEERTGERWGNGLFWVWPVCGVACLRCGEAMPVTGIKCGRCGEWPVCGETGVGWQVCGKWSLLTVAGVWCGVACVGYGRCVVWSVWAIAGMW